MAQRKTKRNILRLAANQVLAGPGFEYEADRDPVYRQYEKTYTRLGKRAMEDTVGKVSAATGGLASSYAQTAGQQAYGNYMAQLADKVPQLEQQAYERYTDKADRAMDQLEMLRKLDQEDYQRQRDAASDARDKRDYDRRVYEDERDFDRDVAQSDRDYTYKVQRDEVQAQADQQKAEQDAAAAKNEQLREDILTYMEQGGTLEGLYKTFGEQAVADSGYLPGQLEQMEAWYKQKNEPKPAATASSGSGKKEEQPKSTDWTETRQWFDTYGEEGMEDWFKANYKKLGFATATQAQAAWNNLRRSEKQAEKAREERLEQARQGKVLDGNNRPVSPVVLDAFNDLLEGGIDPQTLEQILAGWVKSGWYDLDEEGKLSLMATIE